MAHVPGAPAPVWCPRGHVSPRPSHLAAGLLGNGSASAVAPTAPGPWGLRPALCWSGVQGCPGSILPSGTPGRAGSASGVWPGPTFALSGSGWLLLHDLALPGTRIWWGCGALLLPGHHLCRRHVHPGYHRNPAGTCLVLPHTWCQGLRSWQGSSALACPCCPLLVAHHKAEALQWGRGTLPQGPLHGAVSRVVMP